MLPTLLHRRTWDPLEQMRRNLEQWFEQPLTRVTGNGEEEGLTASYPVDIREEDKQILVDAELPGFKKDEVDVSLDQGVLRIKAGRRSEERKEEGEQHLHERRYTRVDRAFTLPCEVDESNVDAKLTDGVLHIVLNKTIETAPKKVAVK